MDSKADAIHDACLLEDESYFDRLISVGSCYIVYEYIPMPQQTYMPACPHEASLRIGKRMAPKHHVYSDSMINLQTVMKIKNKTPEELAKQGRFSCIAKIDITHQDRTWSCVTCTECSRKMLKKTGNTTRDLCADDADGKPKFL